MDAVKALRPELPRVKAFRATDAFVLEAYREAASLRGALGVEIGREIRAVVVRCGGALVAASAATSGRPAERRLLESARLSLAEGRYYLYLARRVGLLDQRRYRGLIVRHEAALRELDAALPDVRPPGRADATPREPG
jgi:hypothetical protein